MPVAVACNCMAAGGDGGCLQAIVVEAVATKVRLQQRKEEAKEGMVVEEEDNNGVASPGIAVVQREIAAGHVVQRGIIVGRSRSLLAVFVQQEIVAGCNQGRWQQEIIAGSIVQLEIIVGRDQIIAGRDQDRWLREIAVGSVVQQEIAAGVTKEDGSER
ncbi:hypothetical protein B296_00017109 [Ensete ventricosum]|uniref:Uncharacterized protein n=1 Tax=Ensete ventricosum TaxID=4639 RepID=A0A426Z588_ENSVE|nr:hypothetical protein B296_00017109 [Ensete ventricosum]